MCLKYRKCAALWWSCLSFLVWSLFRSLLRRYDTWCCWKRILKIKGCLCIGHLLFSNKLDIYFFIIFHSQPSWKNLTISHSSKSNKSIEHSFISFSNKILSSLDSLLFTRFSVCGNPVRNPMLLLEARTSSFGPRCLNSTSRSLLLLGFAPLRKWILRTSLRQRFGFWWFFLCRVGSVFIYVSFRLL